MPKYFVAYTVHVVQLASDIWTILGKDAMLRILMYVLKHPVSSIKLLYFTILVHDLILV